MSCHICSRGQSSQLPFFCSTCACSQLYQLRLENARILLEKEAIGRQIEAIVTSESTPDKGNDVRRVFGSLERGPTSRLAVQVANTEAALSSARTKSALAHVDTLKEEIEEKRNEVSRRTAILAQRRSDAESANYQLPERRDAALTSVQNSIKRTEHLWHALHNKTAESRIFLCREAASVYGLRQKLRKKNGKIREIYVIGGAPILDLREMNGATPWQVSTAFSNIAHLLILVSHYLSLRLPAEITLPQKNYPAPTIFALGASYSSRVVPAPGVSPPQPLSNGSTPARTTDGHRIPRPRPLFIDKSLPKLAKEDPAMYAFFLEGASLLAWNIAWLCRTQGLNIGSDSWEDVCNLGKNMWQLLVAPPAQNSTVMRAFSGRDLQSKFKASRDAPKTTIQRTKSFPMLGHYSHGTSHSFLGAAEGTEFMRTWKLPTPTKIIDKLKASLLGEMASAEWEFLEEREWGDEMQDQPHANIEEQPPAVNLGGDANSQFPNTAQNMATPDSTALDSDRERTRTPSTQTNSGRPKGTSGWMKLKNR